MLITQSPWFVPLRAHATASARLLCIPFAGGSSAVYHDLVRRLDRHIEVIGVELPGRGTRFAEPPLRDVRIVADAVAAEINRWRDLPLAIFGYSNGSLIAFEVLRRLTSAALRRVGHCFLCAKPAPQFLGKNDAIHHLDDDRFLAVIKSYNGTPPEILEDEELLSMFLPVLKADFALSGEYVFTPLLAPLPVRATLIGGTRDEFVPAEKLRAWAPYFERTEPIVQLEGGHFLLQTQERALASLVNQKLQRFATAIEV